MEDGQLASTEIFYSFPYAMWSWLWNPLTKFRTFLDKWTEILASDAGKGSYNIQAYADIGTFRGPRGTWRQYMSGTLFSVMRT